MVIFQKLLEQGLKHWTCARIWTDVSIEQKLQQLTTEVNKALELACPKKLCKRKYKFPTWWNQNLSKLRAKMRFLAKKKGLLKARRPIKFSEENIKMQFQQQKMKDGRNSHLKSNILLMFQN